MDIGLTGIQYGGSHLYQPIENRPAGNFHRLSVQVGRSTGCGWRCIGDPVCIGGIDLLYDGRGRDNTTEATCSILVFLHPGPFLRRPYLRSLLPSA